MSIIFREARSAIYFYDTIDVCKGTSFGTNFTLALPFVQLAHYHNLDRVESYGMPKHLIRLSVGLENEEQILKTISTALFVVEKSEGIVQMGTENKIVDMGIKIPMEKKPSVPKLYLSLR
jgi:cystathionine gamma-synthase